MPRHLLLLALVLAHFAAPGTAAADFDQAGYELAAKTILCDCGCHPQSVHDCACGRAAEMRDEMRAMVAGGMTGEDVIAGYVAEHGEQILIAPEAAGFNLVAWVGPLLVLLAASGAMILVLRRWSRLKGDLPAVPVPASAGPPVDGAYQRRLDRALERME